MHATARPTDDVNGQLAAAPASVDDTTSQFLAGDDRSYADVRRARIRRRRLAGFLVWVPIWALSIVPLAREILADRGGADVAVYLAVGAISLGAATVLRSIYVLLTRRRLLSPWVFLIAAVLALAVYMVQSAGPDAQAAQVVAASSR